MASNTRNFKNKYPCETNVYSVIVIMKQIMKNYEIVWDVFGLREVRLSGVSV